MSDEAAADELRLLLVEDDATIAEMYRLKLEIDGYTVSVARDGETALRMVSDSPPDLVFLDIRLPGMDGLAVLEAIRADTSSRHLPVVILSNFGDEELRERGIKLGALEYLIKAQTTPAGVSERVRGWAETALGEAARG
ncbi:MAG: response regulator, partial [Candidatus Dormibacteraeota bacterium]|nr:response regulator [Candidatus Dormibacteraeota bacterium]MDQ6899832.1 response regulator [Candidatus Dormibacteraeota bacterium]